MVVADGKDLPRVPHRLPRAAHPAEHRQRDPAVGGHRWRTCTSIGPAGVRPVRRQAAPRGVGLPRPGLGHRARRPGLRSWPICPTPGCSRSPPGVTTGSPMSAYRPGDVLLFGPEPTGLTQEVLAHPRVTDRLRMRMLAGRRSLNLSNAAAVAAYEARRQTLRRVGRDDGRGRAHHRGPQRPPGEADGGHRAHQPVPGVPVGSRRHLPSAPSRGMSRGVLLQGKARGQHRRCHGTCGASASTYDLVAADHPGEDVVVDMAVVQPDPGSSGDHVRHHHRPGSSTPRPSASLRWSRCCRASAACAGRPRCPCPSRTSAPAGRPSCASPRRLPYT